MRALIITRHDAPPVDANISPVFLELVAAALPHHEPGLGGGAVHAKVQLLSPGHTRRALDVLVGNGRAVSHLAKNKFGNPIRLYRRTA